MRKTPIALLTCALLSMAARGQESELVCGFESDADMKLYTFKHQNDYFKNEKVLFEPSLSDQHVTQGGKSLKVAPNEYFVMLKPRQDWSAFDTLEIDAFVDGDSPVNGTILIGDKAWEAKRTYWNRHNGSFNLKPGKNVIPISVNGLFRGEAGSRGNDLKTNVNPKEIIRFDIGLSAGKGVNAVYFDNMRLTKETRPEGILAYDFGPPSQTIFPGFSAISPETLYGKEGAKAGLKFRCGSSRARDDTFPTRLYQDWIWFQEDGNHFTADVPNGKNHVWIVFCDGGYWGGEQARYSKRTITANGKVAHNDDRGEIGRADYLFRFESIEPKPGDSLWDLYMAGMFKPVRFEVEITDGKLVLDIQADAQWSAKVAAVVIYPDNMKADAEKWIAGVESRNREEFDSRATFMGPRAPAYSVPDDAKAKGWWLGFPSLHEDVSLLDAPGSADGRLHRVAAKGQRVSSTFAIRALKDFTGEVKLASSDLKGPAGTISAASVDARYVHHLTNRGFSSIAYTIVPDNLRRVEKSGLKLSKELTRQFWLTVAVPEDAKPGAYAGEITLSAGELSVKLPLSVDVLDIALDEPDFNFGYFGVHVPAELSAERRKTARSELFTLLKQNGMNSFSGGPNIKFSGLDAEGKPQLDFAACDEFFKAARECGFTRAVYSYGGPAHVEGLGHPAGVRDWAQKTGKTTAELLKTVWTAVDEHAKQNNWPTVYTGFIDEPRVVETARSLLEMLTAYKDHAPTVRAGGFYSVEWKHNDPLHATIQDIFKTMTWSGLNLHTQDDMDKAKEFGREIHIYNQGLSRFSFGAYQWAEMRKGVKGRMQWHMQCLHGFQFFDLDGREPDTAAIQWGRDEIIPTINLARCREGADDFRFAVTLYNLAQKKKDTPQAQAALAYLEEINKQVGIGQRNAPKGFNDEAFRATCIEHIQKLGK